MKTWVRRGLIALGCAYFVTLWLDGVGSNVPAKFLPRAWLYFCQVSALFPHSSPVVIDYRAEVWSCTDHRWREVDTRPWFPIDADNKENRFQRAMQFYRQERPVMQALEAFILGKAGPGNGGVRFSSLRIPYPKPGEHVEALQRKPMSDYAKDQKKAWYWTPNARRAAQCGSKSEIDRDEAPE